MAWNPQQDIDARDPNKRWERAHTAVSQSYQPRRTALQRQIGNQQPYDDSSDMSGSLRATQQQARQPLYNLDEEQNEALLGLRRAQARDAPEGYETSSAWTMGGNPSGEALGGIYRQREDDRAQARINQGHPDALHAAIMAKTAGGNMRGFMEGLHRNDIATGIADGSYKQKNVRVFAGPSDPGSNQLRGQSAQPPGSIADDPRSTFNTNQSGNRPWGQGGASMQGLQDAGKSLPPRLTDREKAIAAGPAPRPYNPPRGRSY